MKTFSKFKIKEFLFNLPRSSALSALKTFLYLVLVFVGLSLFLAYRDLILVQREDLVLSEQPLEFKEEIYQNVLEIWQLREEKFNQTYFKKYPDFFR